MPIPVVYAHRYVYHFSHIDNLPGGEARLFGRIIIASFRRAPFSPLPGLQARRAEMQVTGPSGGDVHDYVPLFSARSVPCRSAWSMPRMSISTTSPTSSFRSLWPTSPTPSSQAPRRILNLARLRQDPADLVKLDWTAIHASNGARRWRFSASANGGPARSRSTSGNRRYGRVLWNGFAKKRVEAIVGTTPFPVSDFEDGRDRPHWFKDRDSDWKFSLVKAPGEIAMIFVGACEYVDGHAGSYADTAKFKNLRERRDGLRAHFRCLPETGELSGSNLLTACTSGPSMSHTKEVVAKLLLLSEFCGTRREATAPGRDRRVSARHWQGTAGEVEQQWRAAEGRS